MKANYNPFTKEDVVETDHGIITKSVGRYFTHRKPEHFFRKYQGFGISITEVEMAKLNHCTHIIIKYHGKRKNILYRILIKYLEFLEIYNFKDDKQYILPVKEMEIIGEEIGLKEHEIKED